MNDRSRLLVAFPPHIKDRDSTPRIMTGVIIALCPALFSAVYYYGFNAIRVTFFTVFFCVALEFLIQKYIMKTPATIGDGSAAVTGLLLAFNLPSTIPVWQLFVGSVVAIGITKLSFGGLGRNPFNPALVGRAFMLASFPVQMTSWPRPLEGIWQLGADAVTGATPLGKLAEEGVGNLPAYLDMFLGNIGGCIGETSVLAILIGGLYLLQRKIISWHIPVVYLSTFFIFTGLFYVIDPLEYADPIFHLLSGGVMLGAWFMATDIVTSPVSLRGRLIFAAGGGFLCGLIRLFGSYPEGASYSILIMNAFVPVIDKYVWVRKFSKEDKYE